MYSFNHLKATATRKSPLNWWAEYTFWVYVISSYLDFGQKIPHFATTTNWNTCWHETKTQNALWLTQRNTFDWHIPPWITSGFKGAFRAHVAVKSVLFSPCINVLFHHPHQHLITAPARLNKIIYSSSVRGFYFIKGTDCMSAQVMSAVRCFSVI